MFFIATLGAIAFYVQRQAVPETHDVVRTAVTAAPPGATGLYARSLASRALVCGQRPQAMKLNTATSTAGAAAM